VLPKAMREEYKTGDHLEGLSKFGGGLLLSV